MSTENSRHGGIAKGTRHNAGIGHKVAEAFARKGEPGAELRAGKGLYLRKTEGGAFWFFRYVSPVTGKQVRAPLWGNDDEARVGFPAATVEAAMIRASAMRGEVAAGIDPVLRATQAREDRARAAELARQEQTAAMLAAQAEIEARARRMTVRQLFERWCATELQPAIGADGKRIGRKDAGAYVSQQFERHVFPALGDRAIEDVRKADLLALIDAQKAKGQMRTASVLLSDLRQMLSFALDRELIESNPLAAVKKARIVGKAVERDRVLTPDEIKALASALPHARMSKRSEAAIWLLLATGARVGELMGAAWADALPDGAKARRARLNELQALADEDGVKVGVLDVAARTWHLPDTKNQRAHTIHLSDFAVSHFKKLAAIRESLPESDELSPWVFPARNSARPVCVKSFGKQLSDRQREPERRMTGRSKATESLSLPGGRWTAHDLRRTAGTIMATLTISGDVIDECLNHMIESRVRRIYIRDRRETEQANAFDALGAKLAALVDGTPTASNVVHLHAA